jgi:hypothetical protein
LLEADGKRSLRAGLIVDAFNLAIQFQQSCLPQESKIDCPFDIFAFLGDVERAEILAFSGHLSQQLLQTMESVA